MVDFSTEYGDNKPGFNLEGRCSSDSREELAALLGPQAIAELEMRIDPHTFLQNTLTDNSSSAALPRDLEKAVCRAKYSPPVGGLLIGFLGLMGIATYNTFHLSSNKPDFISDLVMPLAQMAGSFYGAIALGYGVSRAWLLKLKRQHPCYVSAIDNYFK